MHTPAIVRNFSPSTQLLSNLLCTYARIASHRRKPCKTIKIMFLGEFHSLYLSHALLPSLRLRWIFVVAADFFFCSSPLPSALHKMKIRSACAATVINNLFNRKLLVDSRFFSLSFFNHRSHLYHIDEQKYTVIIIIKIKSPFLWHVHSFIHWNYQRDNAEIIAIITRKIGYIQLDPVLDR